MSIKLSDTQLAMVRAAAQRDDRCLTPSPTPKDGAAHGGNRTNIPAISCRGRAADGRDRSGRRLIMATTAELVETIWKLIGASPIPIPITLMNHGVEETAAIIGAVVERCARENITLTAIVIDPNLADELGLANGKPLPHGSRPTVKCEPGLGRQVRFQKA